MSGRTKALKLAIAISAILVSAAATLGAGEQQVVLRDHIDQKWKNELVTYPFSAPEGACHPDSVALTGPRGAVPVQLSQIELWPGTQWVKSARLSFIADLARLARDKYTVQYGTEPVKPSGPATDLTVTSGRSQVEITTKHFGVRLLQGEKTYRRPARAKKVPGPVVGMRLGVRPGSPQGARPDSPQVDGTWFGGSHMFGPGKIAAWSAKLTDRGPVFARVQVRYTYSDGNTMDLTVQVAAGDNTMRMETNVQKPQRKDGFSLVLSRGLPPLILQVCDESRRDRDCFVVRKKGQRTAPWAEIPLKDYAGPSRKAWFPTGKLPGLTTSLTPWEDWFGTFTQARMRLKLENTTRELQIRSVDPGAWVEPRPIEELFSPDLDPDPAKSLWVAWNQKCMPLLRDTAGDVVLQVNAEQGVRKWTVSDCLSMPGVASMFGWYGYKPESEFPPETRPAVGYRLDEVKDYVLEWPDEPGRHPLLFVSREELEDRRKRKDTDPELLAKLLSRGRASSPKAIPYVPNTSYQSAVGAYLLSGQSPEVAAKTQLLARLRQALRYELWGVQFGAAGAPTPVIYDAVIDSPVVSKEQRPLLRAQMAYFAYRLASPAVWSAERGYASGNQNMTVTWEISRGLAACAIPKHPMAQTWYRKAKRIMDYFLTHMVGPAGEWPEAMSHHGRQSIDMLLAFAIASTNSGLHDYVDDPRVRRMIMYWAKLQMPRDPRPRGHYAFAAPDRRLFPAMGRDSLSEASGTCGAMARVTRNTDPDYSAVMQWAWKEEGANGRFQHLGGFSYLACDPHLPAKRPAWTSEVFPYAGAVLRHGLGSADEHQVILYCGDHFAAFYPCHTGSFPSIFAYGTPVAGSFPGGYEYQEGYLVCHVGLARERGTVDQRKAIGGHHGCPGWTNMWSWPKGQTARYGQRAGRANVSAFSTLARQDYAAVDVAKHYSRRLDLNMRDNLPEWPAVPKQGQPPVDWRRQTLFLKDDDPSKTAYLLVRDTIKARGEPGRTGGQPTMWQMWTVSETVDTPENVKDVAAVLAKKPGHQILPPRELKGDRFTAIGQLGVDVEYYIASPSGTPRHTLRWGTNMFDWANKLGVEEYQDLLHLQMPGDGAYYVAFFPRKRATPAPTFSTLGGGTVIKVSGAFGTDYGFLSAENVTASGEGTSFHGTAASVQDRKGGLVLTLGAKGEVRYKEHALAAEFPAALRVGEQELTVELPRGIQPPAFEMMKPFPGGTVTVSAPGNWKLPKPLPGVELARSAAGLVLKVPAELKTVTLSKGDRR